MIGTFLIAGSDAITLFQQVDVMIRTQLGLVGVYRSMKSVTCNILWRSIPAKIQCFIFHSTFCILSYICCLTSEFALSSFNFSRATFKFLPCTFTFSYAIFNFTFKFSGLYFQVFAFNIEHLPFKFLPSTFNFTYFTCKFNFLTCTFNRWSSSLWSSWAQLTQYTPANITSERLPTGMGSGDRLLSRQYRWNLLSNMADRQSSSQPAAATAPAASLSDVRATLLRVADRLSSLEEPRPSSKYIEAF